MPLTTWKPNQAMPPFIDYPRGAGANRFAAIARIIDHALSLVSATAVLHFARQPAT